jgi:predicted aspartyl protease
MGLIIKNYTVTGDKDSATVQALLDTGAGASFLRRDIAERVGTIAPIAQPQRLTMADGKETLTVDETVNLNVTMEGVSLFFTFLVIEELGEEMIIGADMMQRWKIRLDPEQEAVSIDPLALRLRV